MGKVLESMGVIKGYDFVEIGKFSAKKDKLFTELNKKDENIQEEVKEILTKHNGIVFAIKKDKVLKGIYLFKTDGKEIEKTVKHEKTVYADSVEEEVIEKYEHFLLELAKNAVVGFDYKKIEFNDKVVEVDPKLSKKEVATSMIIGAIAGFALGWVIFDSIIWGIIYAIIFTPAFSGLEGVVSKKRGRKKKIKEDK